MAQTTQTLAIAASKRLKMDGRSILPLMSFVGNALNNLARQTANDNVKRYYLMTDPDVVTASVVANADDTGGVCDLSSIIDSPQIMLDTLMYGTVFWRYNSTFTDTDVNTTSNTISLGTSQPLQVGDAVRFGNGSGTLPSGLAEDTTYYVIDLSGSGDTRIVVSATQGGTAVALTTTGSGTMTVQTWGSYILQWLQSPNQANLTASIPFNYTYGYVVGTDIRTPTRRLGTFTFNVPFIPTVDTLPVALESDAVDMIVQLAISQGFTPQSEAEK